MNFRSICKPLLLQQNPCVRWQTLNSFHNSRRSIRRPRLEPEQLENFQVEYGPLNAKKLFKPLIFTIGISSASFAGCIIWEYENLRKHAKKYMKKHTSWLLQQKKIFTQHMKASQNPVLKWWDSLRDHEKIFYPILAVNILVFGGWRIRSLQPFMIKYFCSNPSSTTTCIPMLLSTFSHYSPLHLAANMYVLYSFMPAGVAALGKEQFLAMYLSAGVISSLASFFYKVVSNQPGLSLGASGAIMAALSYVCVQYPDTRLSIILLPMFTFSASTAIKAIMTVDLAGVVFCWKFFDHAAHLGGALFGVFWSYWGSSAIWGNRNKLLEYYHILRKDDSR